MSRDYKLYLDDIKEATDKIERFIGSASFEQFTGDAVMFDAVLFNFLVIGEAASHIPSHMKEERPGTQWQEIIGFRNVVAHVYFALELETVWDIIKNDLPALRRTVEDMLAQEG